MEPAGWVQLGLRNRAYYQTRLWRCREGQPGHPQPAGGRARSGHAHPDIHGVRQPVLDHGLGQYPPLHRCGYVPGCHMTTCSRGSGSSVEQTTVIVCRDRLAQCKEALARAALLHAGGCGPGSMPAAAARNTSSTAMSRGWPSMNSSTTHGRQPARAALRPCCCVEISRASPFNSLASHNAVVLTRGARDRTGQRPLSFSFRGAPTDLRSALVDCGGSRHDAFPPGAARRRSMTHRRSVA